MVDFNQTLLGLSNCALIDMNATSGTSFRMRLNATVDPGILVVSLPEGIAIDSSGTENKPMSFKIGYGRPVTKLENLMAWWTFDEGFPRCGCRWYSPLHQESASTQNRSHGIENLVVQ